MDLSPALLECLDGVYRLLQERGPVSAARLARRLEIDVGTATERVLALTGLGLVEGDAGGRLDVTEAGRRLAIGLLRRHRLLERFLTDVLRLPWERVHEHARRLTPVLADDVTDALATFLGTPTHCPHGHPIPAADGTIREDVATPLTSLAPGRRGTIVRIEREEPEALKQLAALGLLPRTEVEVEEIGPLGGPVLVRVGSSRYAVGRNIAGRILVREP